SNRLVPRRSRGGIYRRHGRGDHRTRHLEPHRPATPTRLRASTIVTRCACACPHIDSKVTSASTIALRKVRNGTIFPQAVCAANWAIYGGHLRIYREQTAQGTAAVPLN